MWERMREGLHDLLSLHSASELSAICGTLKIYADPKKFKSLERGHTSIEMITKYIQGGTRDGVIVVNEDKLRKVLSHLWEGAIHEYIALTGHPQLNLRANPREWCMKLWTEGGILMNNRPFVPMYIRREVSKRYEWVPHEDITMKLNWLRECQEKTKIAEKDLIANHDYQGILIYFNTMADLRREENEFRDFLIGEVSKLIHTN